MCDFFTTYCSSRGVYVVCSSVYNIYTNVYIYIYIFCTTFSERPLGDVQERQTIAKLDREELEDKFLSLRDQNIVSHMYSIY